LATLKILSVLAILRSRLLKTQWPIAEA